MPRRTGKAIGINKEANLIGVVPGLAGPSSLNQRLKRSITEFGVLLGASRV